MEDVAKFATKVLVMNKAKVFTYGTVDEVFSKSETISHMGLSIPQISKVFHALSDKGLNVERNVYTVEGAKGGNFKPTFERTEAGTCLRILRLDSIFRVLLPAPAGSAGENPADHRLHCHAVYGFQFAWVLLNGIGLLVVCLPGFQNPV